MDYYKPDAEKLGYVNVRSHISEATAEKYADARIMRLLRTDRAYLHAESAEEQSAREDELTALVWSDIEREYIID